MIDFRLQPKVLAMTSGSFKDAPVSVCHGAHLKIQQNVLIIGIFLGCFNQLLKIFEIGGAQCRTILSSTTSCPVCYTCCQAPFLPGLYNSLIIHQFPGNTIGHVIEKNFFNYPNRIGVKDAHIIY